MVEGINIDLRVFGIDAPGYGTNWLAPPLEEMPKLYAAQIVDIAGKGPCWLCGYSLGGSLAIDTARELLLLGVDVKPVIVLDSRRPDGVRGSKLSYRRAILEGVPPVHQPQPRHVWNYFMGVYFGWEMAEWAMSLPDFDILTKEQRFKALLNRAREADILNKWWNETDIEAIFSYQVKLIHQMSLYKSRSFDHPVIYFFAEYERDQSATIEFLSLVTRECRLVQCRGDHISLLFDSKNALHLGRILSRTVSTAFDNYALHR
jgi:pimeloyl-ACP methyl ester carboxylesterase